MKKVISFIISALFLLTLSLPAGVCFADEETATPSELSPNLVIESYSVNKKGIHSGDSFTLNFKLKNTSSKLKIENILLHLSGGEVFIADGATDTIYTDSISAGGTKSFSKTFYCSGGTDGGRFPISISASYEYFDSGEKFSGTSEASMSISVVKTDKNEGQQSALLTPQLLITDFSYGSEPIQGGNTFTLGFTVKNNSKDITVRNIIIKLNGGETFVVADGTDTISVDSISKNAAVKFSKNFTCLNAAPSGVHPITASISYEYFDTEKTAGSAELVMSVPVVQPDKVQFEGIALADQTVTVDTENDCAFQLINNGQTRLLNGSVKLLDENRNVIVSSFIGNIEPGTQFTSNYNLPVTFTEEGVKKLFIVFEYDNENMEKKSIEQELSVTAEIYVDPYEELIQNEQQQEPTESNYVPIIIGCVAGIVVIIVGAIVIKKAVKKRKAKKGSDLFNEEI